MDSKFEIPMLGRAIDILEYIYKQNRALSLRDISNGLTLPKTSVLRILRTLNAWNIVEYNEKEQVYSLGIQLVKYGKRSKSQYHLLDFSTPELKKLAAQFHVSANLGVPLGDSVLTIHSEMPETSVLAYQSMPTNPLHCSSMGKNILAHSSDTFISDYYKNNKIEQLTPNTITTYKDFMKVRKDIIVSGVAFDDEEYELGLSCISAPIFGERMAMSKLALAYPAQLSE